MKKLYITRIVNDDGGKYSCRASINGQQQQKNVDLQIFKDITFDDVPSQQYPKILTDALIRCVVSGQPMPEVTWRYGGKRIPLDGRYLVTKGQGLTIKNITTDDNGNYTCRAEVDNEGRYDERIITVQVHIPPKIIDDQLKVEGIEGIESTISCKANGIPEPKYEFFKDGSTVALQSTETIKVDGSAGQVKFEPLKKANEGKYTCKAVNDVGEDSASGQLTVLVKPSIYELNSISQKEGSTVTLTCQSSGDPAPNMTFHKAGSGEAMKTVSDGKLAVSGEGKGKLQLTIKNLEPGDAANYTCRAVNKLGRHEMTSSIVVQYAPRFPVNQNTRTVYAWAGSARNLTCHATGEPLPKLEWVVGDRILANNDTYHIYDLESTSHLLVKVRDVDQSWIYTNFVCRARNNFGERNHSIELKRASVPSQPAAVNVTKTMPTMLILNVYAPEEDGGMPVVGYRVEYDSKMLFDIATDGMIRVENLKPSTNYTISVRAKNDVGVGEPRQVVVTTEAIRQPYPVVVTSPAQGTSPFQYKITWDHPDNGGKPITQYRFRLRQMKKSVRNGTEVLEPMTPDWIIIDRPDSAKAPMVEFVLEDLAEAASYEVEILAHNEIGWSQVNEKFTFMTSHASPEDLARASVASPVSVGVVIGITVVVLIIILVIIDVSCYFVKNCGVTMILCSRLCGQSAPFSKEKAAEEGESKEALTKKQAPQETANNAEEMPVQDGPNEQTEVPANGDHDKKPLLVDNTEQPADDEKKIDEPLKPSDEKVDDIKEVEKEDEIKEKTPLVESEKGDAGKENADEPETG